MKNSDTHIVSSNKIDIFYLIIQNPEVITPKAIIHNCIIYINITIITMREDQGKPITLYLWK